MAAASVAAGVGSAGGAGSFRLHISPAQLAFCDRASAAFFLVGARGPIT